jgi:hypothetical protein
LLVPEYSLEVQAQIPTALAAIHNFISIFNPHDQPISSTTSGGAIQMYNDDKDVTMTEQSGLNDSDLSRDMIAQKMRDDYIGICAE